MMRFSTAPFSATSTTSARVGSMRTNSTCFRRMSCLAASTTPAPRDSAESIWPASESTVSTEFASRFALHLAVDALALLRREVADLHHRIDEEAQAELGRQPPGARMRRVDQPHVLQVRHDVADRGGRQRRRQDAAQIARADRIAGLQIGFDDAAEDLARAVVERCKSVGAHFRRRSPSLAAVKYRNRQKQMASLRFTATRRRA